MKHELYMDRAIALAACGLGTTSPNPLVGAVLVHNDRIIGEGWHVRAGEDHAEVRCFDSVSDEDRHLIPESTLYVTLEPCDHQGRTTACSLRILQEQVRKVVVAVEDPHPAVGGKGIQRLKEAGVDVLVGVSAPAARWMNRRFLTAMEAGRPYVVLKWAQTADGFMDPGEGDAGRGPVWITGKRAKQWTHRWRGEEDAILVGRRTALNDDPGLNVREWSGRNPIRLVIDSNSSLPGHLKMWSLPGETWSFGHKASHPCSDRHFEIEWDERSVDSVLKHLHDQEVRSVLVEGGHRTLEYFIGRNIWDEARIWTGATAFGSGIEAPELRGAFVERKVIDEDVLIVLRNTL